MYIWVESYVSKSDTSFCRTQRLFNPLRQAFSRLLLRARWLLGLLCETWLSLHLIGSRALHFDILYFFLAIAGLFFVRAGLKLSGTESFSLEYPAFFFFCCRNKLFKVILFIVENSDITFAHLVSFKWMLTFLMNPSLIIFFGGGDMYICLSYSVQYGLYIWHGLEYHCKPVFMALGFANQSYNLYSVLLTYTWRRQCSYSTNSFYK